MYRLSCTGHWLSTLSSIIRMRPIFALSSPSNPYVSLSLRLLHCGLILEYFQRAYFYIKGHEIHVSLGWWVYISRFFYFSLCERWFICAVHSPLSTLFAPRDARLKLSSSETRHSAVRSGMFLDLYMEIPLTLLCCHARAFRSIVDWRILVTAAVM